MPLPVLPLPCSVVCWQLGYSEFVELSSPWCHIYYQMWLLCYVVRCYCKWFNERAVPNLWILKSELECETGGCTISGQVCNRSHSLKCHIDPEKSARLFQLTIAIIYEVSLYKLNWCWSHHWHSKELVNCKNINYNYQQHCVPTVQLQLQLQLLPKCNHLQLITTKNYRYNIAAKHVWSWWYTKHTLAYGL